MMENIFTKQQSMRFQKAIMKQKILVATTNPGKVAELNSMLGDDVQWVSLAQVGEVTEIVEDGETFQENARKKALGYAEATGMWTLADDSGLVIDALGGEPGVRSSRYSGERQGDRELLDHKNMEKVLGLLKTVPHEKRTARFVCHLCLARPDKILVEAEGVLQGKIANLEVGSNGFGYDPIFFVENLNKTVAQLTTEQKNQISHRGNAIRKLKPLLKDLLRRRD